MVTLGSEKRAIVAVLNHALAHECGEDASVHHAALRRTLARG